MKKFLIHITTIFIFTLLIMLVLDYGYTKIYEDSKPLTKFQMFRSKKGKKIDYAFLGSSRVDNSIIPSIIEKKTGKSALNLGFQASKLDDIYTILKLFKSYDIKSEKIFIQIDYIYNIYGNSNIMQYELIPFINDNEVTQNHFKSFPNYWALKNVPFYRYCINDLKIGFRQVFINIINKKSSTIENLGYSPLEGSSLEGTGYVLPEKILDKNPVYNKIVSYARENNITISFYCAPFWQKTKNLHYVDQLKRKVKGLKDYSGCIKTDTYFSNNSHLNHKGATYFTHLIAKDIISKKFELTNFDLIE